ncbi:MAG: NAD(P)H-hydrate epimerase [Caldilineaceae bacterium]|nr:NAD(P)H-hydrate epimerase [Caldilineaceae bacterium]
MTEILLPALNSAQVHEVNRLLVEEYGMSLLQTMENGGRTLALRAKEMLDGDLADRPIVVVAGRGNNGGGGLVAARHLINWGAWVQILCSHPPEEYAGIPAHQLRTLQAMGAPLAWAEEGWELPPCDLVIDAIIGTGLLGEPHGKARDLIQLANSSVAPILSLDLPSGVDGGTGELFTPHIRATATLTLALPKIGLLADGARRACGELTLGDMGVPIALYEQLGLEVSLFFGRAPIVRWDVVDGRACVME